MQIFLIVVLVIALILGWHIIFPIIGGAIVLTAFVWFFMLGAIILFGIATMLLFIFTRTGVILLAGALFALYIVGVILIPVLFPILIPLLIIFLVISLMRNRRVEHRHKQERVEKHVN